MIVSIKDLSHLFLLVLLTMAIPSCTKKDQEYSYAFYYGEDTIPSSYLIRKISYEGNYRNDFILTSNTMEGPFKQTNKEKFKLVKGGLNKVTRKEDKPIVKPYMTTLDSECIEFLFENGMNDVLATNFCFLGKEDVIIRGKKYESAYKFKKIMGLQHKVESIAYYDTDFILLKEEYVSGYTDEYRIIRLD